MAIFFSYNLAKRESFIFLWVKGLFRIPARFNNSDLKDPSIYFIVQKETWSALQTHEPPPHKFISLLDVSL